MFRLFAAAIAILLLSAFSEVSAQNTSVNLYGGYVFDYGIEYPNVDNSYEGTVNGGITYGVGFEYQPRRSDYSFEVLYFGQNTESPIVSRTANSSVQSIDLNINFALAGATAIFKASRRSLYSTTVGAMAGVSFIKSTSQETGASTNKINFAWGMRIGGKYLASEKIAFNFSAQMLMTTQRLEPEFIRNANLNGSQTASILPFSIVGGLSYYLNRD